MQSESPKGSIGNSQQVPRLIPLTFYTHQACWAGRTIDQAQPAWLLFRIPNNTKFASAPTADRTKADLQEIPPDELIVQSLAQAGRRALDDDASGLESSDLGVGTTLSTSDNGTSVAHATARGSRDTSDEADNGLAASDGVVGLEELSGLLLSGTTNLADHDDTVCLLVLREDLETVDEVGAAERVTTDTDDERLTQAGLSGLVDSLVGQGTGTGDDTDTAALVDEAGHDADLALARGDDTGAVGADETGLGLGLEHVGNAHHVCNL